MKKIRQLIDDRRYPYTFSHDQLIEPPPQNLVLDPVDQVIEPLHRDLVLGHLYPALYRPDEFALKINLLHFYFKNARCDYHRYQKEDEWRNIDTIKSFYAFTSTCKFFYHMREEFFKRMKPFDPWAYTDALYGSICDYNATNAISYAHKKNRSLFVPYQPHRNNSIEGRQKVRGALMRLINNGRENSPFYLSDEKVLYTILSILHYMREQNFDINERFNCHYFDDSLPLMAACKNRNVTLVKLLLHTGADPRVKDVCHLKWDTYKKWSPLKCVNYQLRHKMYDRMDEKKRLLAIQKILQKALI